MRFEAFPEEARKSSSITRDCATAETQVLAMSLETRTQRGLMDLNRFGRPDFFSGRVASFIISFGFHVDPLRFPFTIP